MHPEKFQELILRTLDPLVGEKFDSPEHLNAEIMSLVNSVTMSAGIGIYRDGFICSNIYGSNVPVIAIEARVVGNEAKAFATTPIWKERYQDMIPAVNECIISYYEALMLYAQSHWDTATENYAKAVIKGICQYEC